MLYHPSHGEKKLKKKQETNNKGFKWREEKFSAFFPHFPKSGMYNNSF